MKKNFRKSVLLLLAGVIFFSIMLMENSMSVQAGGAKAKQAIRAYQKFLGQKQIEWSGRYYKPDDFEFILADVNSDETPELLLCNTGEVGHYQGYEAVYYYYKKKVVRADVDDEITGYYPKGGVVMIEHHGMGGCRTYTKIPKNGKNAAYEIGIAWNTDSDISGYQKEKTTYHWGTSRTEVSKSRFNQLLKKEAGKKKVKIKSSQWKRNTAANRKKMSKW